MITEAECVTKTRIHAVSVRSGPGWGSSARFERGILPIITSFKAGPGSSRTVGTQIPRAALPPGSLLRALGF